MSHPAIAVQELMHATLSNDADLVAHLGGAHVYDDVPGKRRPPFVSFGEAVHSDWSTGTEEGIEHSITLNVWSQQRGRKEVLLIADAISTALASYPEVSSGQQIINMAHEFTEVSRDEETGYFLAKVNYRVVTEPVPIITQ